MVCTRDRCALTTDVHGWLRKLLRRDHRGKLADVAEAHLFCIDEPPGDMRVVGREHAAHVRRAHDGLRAPTATVSGAPPSDCDSDFFFFLSL